LGEDDVDEGPYRHVIPSADPAEDDE
jgi:hypothetical protein